MLYNIDNNIRGYGMKHAEIRKRINRVINYHNRYPQKTQDEIATHFNYSPARVSQILMADSKKREGEINAN